MASTGNKQVYGVTEPISMAEPTENDLRLTKELEQTLWDMGSFESEEEASVRQEVLAKLNIIVKEWVLAVAKMKSIPESMWCQVGGCIHTFGSYRLGVHGRGADIDTLCLAPRHVDRESFFAILYKKLVVRPEVTAIEAIPDAFVPVIKMTFSNISIDLIMARLERGSVDESAELLNTDIIRSVDEVSVRSINGCRVTDQILSLVPNVENFRLALRCIKHWAQRRGIYPNAMGFLGGIGWAMLVARTCQLYPNATSSTLVSRFFLVFNKWAWPAPVLLRHVEDANLGMKVWNPKIYPKDGKDLMPIITPAYPSMNASHNVSRSTLRLMKEEFLRGVETMIKIDNKLATWHDLFTPTDFFSRHKNFIQVDGTSLTETDHRHLEHLLEVRLKLLVLNLEHTANVVAAYPYTKGFTCKMSRAEYEALQGSQPIATEPAEEGKEDFVWQVSFFVALIFPEDTGTLRVNLSMPVTDFIGRIKERSEKGESLALSVHHLKRRQLPDFVWGDGERPAKRKRKNKGSSTSNKKQKGSNAKANGSPSTYLHEELKLSTPAQDHLAAETPHVSKEMHEVELPKPASPNGAPEVETEEGGEETDLSGEKGIGELLEAMKREVTMHELESQSATEPMDESTDAPVEEKEEEEDLPSEEIGDELTFNDKRMAQPLPANEKPAIKLVRAGKTASTM